MGLRDSGNHGPGLVNGALVSENAIVQENTCIAKGGFAKRNVSHKLPVARKFIRGPHFGFDDMALIATSEMVCLSNNPN